MQEIRYISSESDIRNIYKMDESGLLYSMVPRMTYLTQDEHTSSTKGREIRKHKRRVRIFMCKNADGIHVLTVSWLSTTANPKCFQDARFISMLQNYRPQSNGWMHSKEFLHWIRTEYEKIKSYIMECGSFLWTTAEGMNYQLL